MFKRKPIYHYKMLEKYKIDINKTIAQNDGTLLKKLCESNNYIFYEFQEKNAISNDTYILRQNKDKIKKVTFFGKYEGICCVYEEHFFMTRIFAELFIKDHIICIDVETGYTRNYRWRSSYGNIYAVNGYGRCYNQDQVKKMYVKDDQLIMEINRKKADSEESRSDIYNIDMDYILYVKKIGEDFFIEYSYENE